LSSQLPWCKMGDAAAEPSSKRPRTGPAGGQSKKQMTLFAAFQRPPATPQSTPVVQVDEDVQLAQAIQASLREAAPGQEGPESKPSSSLVETAEAAAARAQKQAEHDAATAATREAWLPRLGESWYKALEAELKRPSIEQTVREVEELRAKLRDVVFPPSEAVFRAFPATPLDQVKVVIVGQDPYHGRGQAMGLSFSVPKGRAVPPSLQNMLREAGMWPAPHGDLTSWTQQGVLLLNSVLTVLEGQANSHKNLGWERFTDAAIRAVSRERKGVIFLLWGRDAQNKAKLVDPSRHTVLTAGHPSPLSYEKHFKGCGHFKKVNEILVARGDSPIDWQIR